MNNGYGSKHPFYSGGIYKLLLGIKPSHRIIYKDDKEQGQPAKDIKENYRKYAELD